ncbi:MAG: hypothetical protein LKG17_05295, partial [Megasphaera sp.]|nr:hypothetical protein [Megasphaera sp.]
MNKIFKVIWSKTKHCYVVVSELANNVSSNSENKRGSSRMKAARYAVMGLLCCSVMASGSMMAEANFSGGGGTASGSNSVSIGSGAVSSKTDTITIGTDNKASANVAIAIGRASEATGEFATAIGSTAYANGRDSVAIGTNTAATKDIALAFGSGSKATGVASAAIGASAKASAENAFSMGTNSSAAAVNATAIGAGANATGVVSAAIGTSAKASESNATALGPGATASAAGASALGGSSKATIADSVALGDNSATSVAVKVANAKVGNITYTFSTAGDAEAPTKVVSVGSSTIKRQIQNVANGQVTSASTDAINGSQLYAVAGQVSTNLSKINTNTTNIGINKTSITNLTTTVNKGWEADVNGTKVKAVTPTSNKLNFVAGKNVTIIGSGDNITVKTVDSPSFTNVTATGNVTVGGKVTAASETIGGKVNIGSTGITMGNTKITGLAAGTLSSTSTDAVNGSQPFATNTNVTNNATAITKVTNAVNAGWEADVNGTKVKAVTPTSNKLNFVAGKNITITGSGDDITVKTVDSPSFTNVTATGNVTAATETIGGKVNIGSTGITMGNTKITGLTPGAVNSTSTDAINGSQLYETNQTIGKGLTFVGNTGSVNKKLGDRMNIVGTGGDGLYLSDNVKTEVDSEGNLLIKTKNTYTTGVTVDPTSKKATFTRNDGQSYSLDFGDIGLSTTDYRLVGAKNTATGKYTNSYAVGDDNSVSLNVMDPNTGDLDQVTITDIAKASDIQDVKDNAVLYDNTGKDSVTLKGTNGTKITNLKDGDISSTSSDAVNGSQLYETNQNVTNLGDTVTN